MRKILTLIFIIAGLITQAQDIKKGFKNLEKGEYDKAKEAFEKNLEDNKDNVGANFGMALILADDQSPLFDIIDSWQYVENIEGKTGNLSQEDIEIISEYFLNTEVRRTSRPVKKKMEIATDAIEARLIKYIREENNLDAVYEVLDRYPDFPHYDNVIHIRNQFEFRKFEKQNTLAGYQEFLERFPDAAQRDKAIRHINEIAFEETKAKNTVDAYNAYIRNYPESDNLQTAIKMRNAAAYAQAYKLNTLAAYEEFIETYPEALEIADAKTRQQTLLYEQAKRIQSLQAYNEFISRYPDGMYFIDIFNLKASELGTAFLRDHNFDNPAIVWAKGYDNNSRIESGGSIAVTPDNQYIVACNTRDTDTSYADAWVIRVDENGKMLWNKTIGQAFEDTVISVLTDSKGDILVLGYTCMSEDSGSRMGWMFKLGADGKKIWNKTLGKVEINSCAIDQNDRIYIGSSMAKDTLGNHYSLSIYNQDARKVSERVYTGRGSVNDIIINSRNQIMLCGSNWITLMDNRRYMIWDETLPEKLTATRAAYSASEGYYIGGANEQSIFYARYSGDGKKLWLQDYDKSDTSQWICKMATTGNGNLMVLESKQDGAKIKSFSPSGTVLSVKELYNPNLPVDARSESGNTYLLINNGDLVVLRFSNLSSL
jgi:tetratricopeptide (TPR) repeat protein